MSDENKARARAMIDRSKVAASKLSDDKMVVAALFILQIEEALAILMRDSDDEDRASLIDIADRYIEERKLSDAEPTSKYMN